MKRRIRFGRMRSRSSNGELVGGLTVLILTLGILQLMSLYRYTDDNSYAYSKQRLSDKEYLIRNTQHRILSPYTSNEKQDSHTTIRKQDLPSSYGQPVVTSYPGNSNVTSGLRFKGSDMLLRVSHHTHLYGYRRTYKGFLTIGIPSVRRPGTNSQYLFETLTSIIKNTSPVDRPTVVVVIFLCDFNSTYNTELGDQIYRKYTFYCDTGFMQILKSWPGMYPDLENIEYDNTEGFDRVKWRTKQNIDFASLMLYCINISDYYMHLEDDVITSNAFVTDIARFIGMNNHWFLLEFSTLGFIGKLFKSRDLEWISWYLVRHYISMPGDLLLGRMRKERGQRYPIHSEYSLFQHNGKYSSLKGKMMPSMDITFKDSEVVNVSMQQLPKGDNPPADIHTSFKIIEQYPPINAYDNNPNTYCWSKTPTRGDDFVLQFKRPWNFTRIVISTGNIARKQDSLRVGTLDVAEKSNVSGIKELQCGKFKSVVDFVDGEIDTDIMNVKVPKDIICLKIRVNGSNKSWLILREIVLIT